MVAASAFQGLGKTYSLLIGAALDNALFAGLVLTLPAYFGWELNPSRWIKLATALAEVAVVAASAEIGTSAGALDIGCPFWELRNCSTGKGNRR